MSQVGWVWMEMVVVVPNISDEGDMRVAIDGDVPFLTAKMLMTVPEVTADRERSTTMRGARKVRNPEAAGLFLFGKWKMHYTILLS